MNDNDRLQALLDIVDPERSEDRARSLGLVVLGLACPAGRNGFRPTAAGWNVLGRAGAPFSEP